MFNYVINCFLSASTSPTVAILIIDIIFYIIEPYSVFFFTVINKDSVFLKMSSNHYPVQVISYELFSLWPEVSLQLFYSIFVF